MRRRRWTGGRRGPARRRRSRGRRGRRRVRRHHQQQDQLRLLWGELQWQPAVPERFVRVSCSVHQLRRNVYESDDGQQQLRNVRHDLRSARNVRRRSLPLVVWLAHVFWRSGEHRRQTKYCFQESQLTCRVRKAQTDEYRHRTFDGDGSSLSFARQSRRDWSAHPPQSFDDAFPVTKAAAAFSSFCAIAAASFGCTSAAIPSAPGQTAGSTVLVGGDGPSSVLAVSVSPLVLTPSFDPTYS